MTWRNPQYAFLHMARTAGAAAITPTPAAAADNPVDFLVDDRQGDLFKFGSSSASAKLEIDRGATGLEAITRILIPPGHNLDTMDIIVEADDDVAFGTPTTLLASTTVAAGWIDETLTSNTERYVRIRIIGTGTWELPELIFTRTRTLSDRGPAKGWTDMLRHNTLHFEKDSGAVASLSRGSDRRLFEYVYHDVKLASDLLVFSDLLAEVGTSKPFILDPAFDTEPAFWVKLTEDSHQQQDPDVPAATDSTQRQIPLSMLEHLA